MASRTVTIGQMLAILLSVTVTKGSFEQPQASPSSLRDTSTQAAGYLAEAISATECTPKIAVGLSHMAYQAASRGRERDKVRIAMLGDLKSQARIKAADADRRIAQLKAARKQASGLVKQFRLQSAERTLMLVDQKSCYAGLSRVRDQIRQQASLAEGFVARGDQVVETQTCDAMVAYQEARRIDTEFPKLDVKLAHARDVQGGRTCNPAVKAARATGNAARKVVPVVIGLAILGGIVYYLATHVTVTTSK